MENSVVESTAKTQRTNSATESQLVWKKISGQEKLASEYTGKTKNENTEKPEKHREPEKPLLQREGKHRRSKLNSFACWVKGAILQKNGCKLRAVWGSLKGEPALTTSIYTLT
jgi:hypothetical protein